MSKTTWPSDYVELFWQNYPRRVAKKDAVRALDKVCKSGEVQFETLLAAVKNFARLMKGKDPQYVPYPATWLNRGQWEDDLPAVPDESDAAWRARKSYEETMARRRMQ